IMASAMFTVGLWLKTYQTPDDAASALRTEPIAELYRKGRARIDDMLTAARTVHAKILDRLVKTKNVFYRSTIKYGIEEFFKLYHPDFSAHEIHITADYTPYNPIPELAGIEFISAYLSAIYYENQFCRSFRAGDIHHLLCGYSENYQRIPFNIYEQTLTAAIGCVLAGMDARRLDITENAAAQLSRLFAEASADEIPKIVQKSVNELTRIFGFSDALLRYVRKSLPSIASKLEVAARMQTLDRVFYPPAYPENKPKLLFSFGNQMENEKYREIVSEIIQCRFSQDKLAIIKSEIHSLADLDDVFQDAELSPEEIRSVLRELSFPEIAALVKRHSILTALETDEYEESEPPLIKCLCELVSALPREQRELLTKASEAIREE
ncbi:MAG: DUF6179 domain-containing protein, partial [Oscillospiraceae bacterium]|nr:DUF6179 domain-containing protein [Oscillospiraceae bacterium]